MSGANADLFDVSDRLALVTGSSRGLGRALALTLARGGARVVVHGRDAAAVEDTRAEAEELSGRPAHAVTFDVTDAAAVESAVGELLAQVGVPDILVNNAGVQRRAPIHEFAVSDWDDIVAMCQLADRAVGAESETAARTHVAPAGAQQLQVGGRAGDQPGGVEDLPGPGDVDRLDALEADEDDALRLWFCHRAHRRPAADVCQVA